MSKTAKNRPRTQIAPTYSECIEKIREQWGDDYTIVDRHQTTVPKFFGIGSKPAIEVTYVVTDSSSIREGMQRIASEPPRSAGSADGSRRVKEEALRQLIDAALARPASGGGGGLFPQNDISLLTKQVEELNSALARLPAVPQSVPVIKRMEELLEENEFTPSYIRGISARIRSEFSLDELNDEEKVEAKVVEWIGESIELYPHRELSRKPTVLILVGPTGVGKTTTIAKMAAQYRLGNRDLHLRMVSIDHFRIAAQEQMKIYGEHMEIPTTAAASAQDIADLLRLDGNRLDVMLIDTIGLSPHDYETIGKMRAILDIPNCKPNVFLAVSASTKASDLKDIFRNYETFEYEAVIVTKFDETSHIGNILSVLQEKRKPVAFISSGQVVPRDFEEASVLTFLAKLSEFKIDVDSLKDKFPPLSKDKVETNKIDGGTL